MYIISHNNYISSKTNFLSYICTFIFISTLLYLYPFQSDDWIFSEANNFNDCISSTWKYYHTGNGRIIPNFLSYLNCGVLPKWCYAIITGGVFTSFLYFIIALSKVKKGIFLITLFTLLLPVPMKTIFWRCGNANYLYPALFMLLSIKLFNYSNTTNSILRNIGFFIIGLVTGISHEAVGLPLLGGFSVYLLFEKKVSKTQAILLTGIIFGLAINLLAPGTSVRVDGLQTAPFFNLIKCIYSELKTSWFSLANIVLIFFIIKQGKFGSFFKDNKLLFILWSIQIVFIHAIAIKSVPVAGRVLFYQECIAFILFLKILYSYRPSLFGNLIIEIPAFILLAGIGFHFSGQFNSYNLAINHEIQTITNNNDSIQRANLVALLLDPNSTTNKSFSRIYNKPVLYGLKTPIYEDVYINGSLDESKQTILKGQVWYNYYNYYIRELKSSEDYAKATYWSTPYIHYAPDCINQLLEKAKKSATIPVCIIHSKNNKRFVIVPIEGETSVKKIISITLHN